MSWKKFELQSILVWEYKKKNDRQIFHSSAKLIASDTEIDEAFKSMHQGIMAKIKYSTREDWIFIEIILKHSIKIFEC